MFNAPTDYKEQIVAFIDILGFSSLIDKMEDDNKLHETLHWALTYIHSFKKHAKEDNTAQANLNISVFSDCIVITGDLKEFHSIIWAAGWLQAQLLGYGILTRGGISTGKIFHSDEILYGKGMLKAYAIESKAAVYPRIVLDPSFSNSLPGAYRSIFLSLDTDMLYYIDPFSLPGTIGDVTAQLEDAWDPHEIYLNKLEKRILTGISNSKSVEHLAKWNWLLARHAIAKEEYLKTHETRWTLLLKEFFVNNNALKTE